MREKRKGRVETRRRKALRRTAVFLAALLAVSALHLYALFPMQGVRYAEETYHTGKTRAVARMLPPKQLRLGPALIYLTENENAVLLSITRFYPLYGWMDGSGSALDCSDGAPIHVGVWNISRSGDDWRENANYLFGRIDDPAVSSLRIRLCRLDNETQAYQTVWTVPVSEESWTERDGMRYFACAFDYDYEAFMEQYDSVLFYFSDALDAAGRVLYTQTHDETSRTGTSLG